MDDFSVKVLGALVALGAGLMVMYQVYTAFIGSKLKELGDSLHKLKNSVVSISAWNERNTYVDKLLEDRRNGERDLHDRINEHAEVDQQMHSEVLAKLGEISSAVSFIKGRLDK
jgi:hypothetical protein